MLMDFFDFVSSSLITYFDIRIPMKIQMKIKYLNCKYSPIMIARRTGNKQVLSMVGSRYMVFKSAKTCPFSRQAGEEIVINPSSQI